MTAPRHWPQHSRKQYVIRKGKDEVALSLEDCLARERRKIVQRRTNSNRPPEDEGTVGLALSGGGVRSAAFNVGLLQAFRKRGILRQIDYLSTVSGGSYVGSYLSSLSSESLRAGGDGLATNDPAPDGVSIPLLDDCDRYEAAGIVTDLVQRCRYLGQLAPWLNRQLIGLFVINLLLISGLLAFCAFYAWLFRWLDLPVCRDFKASLGFQGDILQAFFPAFALLALWLLTWMATYFINLVLGFRHVHEVLTRFFLQLAVTALCLGTAALMGTGYVSLNGWHRHFGLGRSADDFVTHLFGDYFSTAFVGSVAVMLMPYLRPRLLLRFGMQPRSALQSWIYQGASRGLVIGVPLLVFFAIARDNVSREQERLSRTDQNSDRGNLQIWLDPNDFSHWSASDVLHIDILDWSQFWNQVEADASVKDADESYRPVAGALLAPPAFAEKLLNAARDSSQFQDSRCQFDELHRYDAGILPCIWFNRFIDLFWHVVALDPGSANHLPLRAKNRQARADVLRHFNSVLRDPSLHEDFGPKQNWIKIARHDSDAQAILNAMDELSRLEAALEAAKRDRQESLIQERTLQIVAHNRILLSSCYPEQIAAPGTVFSARVLNADQKLRWNCIAWAFGVFVACSLLVNLNESSLHGWYREALAQSWFAHSHKPADVRLSDVASTKMGLPYHLINATVNLTFPQLSNDKTDNFVMSQCFCGSELTGYVPTKLFADGNTTLSTAMAVSGGAVSIAAPQARGPLAAILMAITNSRLGQWFPNPGRVSFHRPSRWPKWLVRSMKWLRRRIPISPALVLYDWLFFCRLGNDSLKGRRYCFLSDGGHQENLGVQPLLLRRCRIIIASDASDDPNYGFADFDRLQRIAKEKFNIEFGSPWCPDGPVTMDQLVPGANSRLSRCHVMVMRIKYANDPFPGYLFYLKPSFTGDEGRLLRYRDRVSSFPFDPTYDQLFDEDKFRAYMELGRHIGDSLPAVLNDLGGDSENILRFQLAD